jgi:MFS family permease
LTPIPSVSEFAKVPFLCRFMGFRSNPLASVNQRIAMVSNFSTSYNVVNIGYAMHILMKSSHYRDQKTVLSDSICSSSLIAGMVLGQLCGGALGDYLARKQAMLVVMCIQMLAALGSALSSPIQVGGLHLTIFHILAMWRFLLGVGCGGVYPLAATLTAESSTCKREQAKLIALTFSTQGIGFLCAPLITWALVSYFGEDDACSIWRIILGVGSLPAIYIFASLDSLGVSERSLQRDYETVRASGEGSCQKVLSRLNTVFFSITLSGRNKKDLNQACILAQESTATLSDTTALPSEITLESEYFIPTKDPESRAQSPSYNRLNDDAKSSASMIDFIQEEEDLILKLCGTAACWFLFDVLFYGNTLFTPVVLEKAFGPSETLLQTARDATVLNLISLPGYFVSVFTIGKYQTPAWVQTQGFMFMAVLYGMIGLSFDALSGPGTPKSSLLVLYGLTFFFSNYGPNTSTFMLPSLTFSPRCRSTLNGICAACGKIGALLGATLFAPVANKFGDGTIMLACAFISVLGLVLTCTSLSVIGQRKSRFKLGCHSSSMSLASVFSTARQGPDFDETFLLQGSPEPAPQYGATTKFKNREQVPLPDDDLMSPVVVVV